MYRFHGRAMELLELERAFRRHPALVVTGMGGMGKTALSREAADWWLRTKRFEAAVFHSFEQEAGTERVVQVLGQALEGEEFSSRPAEEQWTAAVALFRQRRVLFVWDNFESTLPEFQKGEDDDSPLQFGFEERQRLRKLYRELTEDDPAGRILVTCRPQETELPGIREMPLRGLARPDSLHLLAAVLYQRSISTDRVGYEREAIDALLKTVDDHPLSISLVAPHLKTLTPAQIREELREGLVRFTDESAEEGRNRSLLASLAFSTRRLSEEARGVLPYLAWFEGGVFERNLIHFAELDDSVWESIRGELVATALIRLEEVDWASTAFLRFHPTLPFAAQPYGMSADDAGDVEAVEKRFIDVYLSVRKRIHKALNGTQPATGMALLSLEETNFLAALRYAFRRGARREGGWMADTLGDYLERAGRRRERDEFLAWVHSRLPAKAKLDQAAYGAILQHALALANQNRVSEAVAMVQNLIARLETEGIDGREDPWFQIATSYLFLGRIYVEARQPALGIEPLQRAIATFKGRPGQLAKGNLSGALGDLANAYSAQGQLNEALAAGEQALVINRELGRNRNIASAGLIIAMILTKQERYAQAEPRYAEALEAARAADDVALQGQLLQNQATMKRSVGDPGLAIDLYKEALVLFLRAEDTRNEMRTCDLLGTAKMDLGHLKEAEAWFLRSRELAEKRRDRFALAISAHNIGILQQKRAEQAGDPESRAKHRRQAVSSIEESLAIKLAMDNLVGAASSHNQLGILYKTLGKYDRAKQHLHQSLRIRESRNLPDVWKVYRILAEVASASGDAKAAAKWQAKCDAKLAELERLRTATARKLVSPPS
jgi:tetratricopeptide (TPR) repeat protein